MHRRARAAVVRAALGEFLLALEVAPFDTTAAHEYGRIRAALERSGKPIDPLDTLIAAHALVLGVVLVSHNAREFGRVAGLRVDHWMNQGWMNQPAAALRSVRLMRQAPVAG